MVLQSVPSQTVLEGTPDRALKLLSAASRYTMIFDALATRGYTRDDHEEGWRLFLIASGYQQVGQNPAIPLQNASVAGAVAQLDAWDEPNLRIVRAALVRRHPEQAKFVLSGLETRTGAGAVVVVAKLIDRLDALESSPEREATREADHAALATLALQGLTPEARTSLRRLVETAQLPARTEPAAPQPVAVEEMSREEALLRLRSWYEEWSETAKVVIKRRDLLIRMGLARRRNLSTRDEEPQTETAGQGARRTRKEKLQARKEKPQARKEEPQVRKEEPAAELKG